MLKTERLHLRNLRLSDLDTLVTYRNDETCSRFQRWEDTDRESLLRFIQAYSKSNFPSKEPEQHYAVAEAETDAIVGDLTVFYTEKDNCFTLGITVSPTRQKRGYAYEILNKTVARLRVEFPSVDIVALIEKENAASIALFKKLNFIEESYAPTIRSYVFVLYGNTKD